MSVLSWRRLAGDRLDQIREQRDRIVALERELEEAKP